LESDFVARAEQLSFEEQADLLLRIYPGTKDLGINLLLDAHQESGEGWLPFKIPDDAAKARLIAALAYSRNGKDPEALTRLLANYLKSLEVAHRTTFWAWCEEHVGCDLTLIDP
jgi:hypothetical protein